MSRVPDITDCLPALQTAEQRLHDYANETLGIEYRLAEYGAFRDEADTTEIMGFRTDDYNAAVRANPKLASVPINSWRPIAPFGRSYHDYGAAFDVEITDQGRYNTPATALQVLKAAASQFGLSSDVPNDPPHFELDVSLSQAQQMWNDYSGGADSGLPSGTANSAALVTVGVVGLLIVLLRKLRS